MEIEGNEQILKFLKITLTKIDTILNVGGERGEGVLSDFQN